jgi:hypothetical protein
MRSPWSWGALAFWAACFYVALVLSYGLHLQSPIAILLSFPIVLLLWWGWPRVLAYVIRPVVERFLRPVEIPAPPEAFRSADGAEAWVQPPPITYPALAVVRGQSGWVALQVRRARDGRIVGYQVSAQAPGRMFEKAVARGLSRARLGPPKDGAEEDVAKTLVSFAAPGRSPPHWLRTPPGPWST